MNGQTSKERLARKAELENKHDPSDPQTKQPNAINGWNNTAKARSVSQWAQLIETIEDDVVRAQAARIVWWDHVAPQQKLLDKYLIFKENETPMDILKVRKALVLMGYPKRVARKRVKKQEAPVGVEAESYEQQEDVT